MDINEGKEKLTVAIIKKELMKNLTADIIRLSIVFPLLVFIFWCFAEFFTRTTLYPIVTKVLIIIYLLLFFPAVIIVIHSIVKIKKERFTIRKAVLYKKEEARNSRRNEAYASSRLFFDRCGCYSVSDYTYYKWSHAYSMLPDDFYKSSRIDDHFTLILMGNSIVMVYNDKFFDTSSIQYSE